MKFIAAFVLVAVLAQQQPSVAQEATCSPIVLAHQPSLAASPVVTRHAVHYASSPRGSYTIAPAASYAGPRVVSYSPALPHTVQRPPTVVAYPDSYSPAPVIYAPQAAPVVPSGYYLGRGIIGQRKLYGVGQPIRNALRFLTF